MTHSRVAAPAFDDVLSFTFQTCGCPALALFARAGTMLPIRVRLSHVGQETLRLDENATHR